jgi:soluble lytic murein transglycosylase-like protein
MNDLEAIGFVAILIGLLVVVGLGFSPIKSSQPLTNQALDYHQIARQDALNAGINPDIFERQINQESGFNPSAVSQAGAIGIAQIMPSTAQGWNVDPHDPVASLQAAANAMASYLHTYGSYDKALACYNAGCSALDTALARCGPNWETCVPSETQGYIAAIVGG